MFEQAKSFGKKVGKQALITGGYMGGAAGIAELANAPAKVDLLAHSGSYETALDYSDPGTYVGLLIGGLILRTIIRNVRLDSYYDGKLDANSGKTLDYSHIPKF